MLTSVIYVLHNSFQYVFFSLLIHNDFPFLSFLSLLSTPMQMYPSNHTPSLFTLHFLLITLLCLSILKGFTHSPQQTFLYMHLSSSPFKEFSEIQNYIRLIGLQLSLASWIWCQWTNFFSKDVLKQQTVYSSYTSPLSPTLYRNGQT